jgi:hypothetical protein
MKLVTGVAKPPRAVMMLVRLIAYATARRTCTSFQGAAWVFMPR